MYHSRKDNTPPSKPSKQKNLSHPLPIEDIPYSEEEMAFLRRLAQRQEEDFNLPEE